MTLSSDAIPVVQLDLAARRAVIRRRRQRLRRREWLGLVCLSFAAVWLASAALVALVAR